jgi:hypothetical protein
VIYGWRPTASGVGRHGLLTQGRVRVTPLARHTTNLFRVLDLRLFGVFQRHGQYRMLCQTENWTGTFIFKTCKDFRLTMIDTNIWEAFQGIGLLFHGIDDVERM